MQDKDTPGTVWAVSSGQYSDYRVHDMYTSEERANQVAITRNKMAGKTYGDYGAYFVEEFALDPDVTIDGLPTIEPCFLFGFRDGKVKTIGWDRSVWWIKEWYDVTFPRVWEAHDPYGGGMAVFVRVTLAEARDDQPRSLKIATDRFAQWQAEQVGIA